MKLFIDFLVDYKEEHGELPADQTGFAMLAWKYSEKEHAHKIANLETSLQLQKDANELMKKKYEEALKDLDWASRAAENWILIGAPVGKGDSLLEKCNEIRQRHKLDLTTNTAGGQNE